MYHQTPIKVTTHVITMARTLAIQRFLWWTIERAITAITAPATPAPIPRQQEEVKLASDRGHWNSDANASNPAVAPATTQADTVATMIRKRVVCSDSDRGSSVRVIRAPCQCQIRPACGYAGGALRSNKGVWNRKDIMSLRFQTPLFDPFAQSAPSRRRRVPSRLLPSPWGGPLLDFGVCQCPASIRCCLTPPNRCQDGEFFANLVERGRLGHSLQGVERNLSVGSLEQLRRHRRLHFRTTEATIRSPEPVYLFTGIITRCHAICRRRTRTGSQTCDARWTAL